MNDRHFFSAVRPLGIAAVVFVIFATASGIVVWRSEANRLQGYRSRIQVVAQNRSNELENTVDHAMSVTYALAALVKQGDGSIRNFEQVAGEMLHLYPGLTELVLSPGGVVTQIAPLAGNEHVLGFKQFSDPLQKKEALLARDTGKLTLAGPLNLKEGGLGMVGRLPVFLERRDGGNEKYFWGFTNAIVRFPEALAPARLPNLVEDGIAYELWRIDPNTGKKQTIDKSAASPTDPVDTAVTLPNVGWTLSLSPVEGWGDPSSLSLKISLGVLLSFLISYIVKLLLEARYRAVNLETLVDQRTAAIKVLSSNAQRLRNALDSISSYAYLKDTNSRYVYANRKTLELFGCNAEELVGSDDSRFFPPDTVKRLHEIDKRVFAGENSAEEIEVVDAPGARRVYWEVKTPIYADAERKIIWGLCGISTDITERKALEESLVQATTELQDLYDHAPCGYHSLAPDGTYLRVNETELAWLGCTREELIGRMKASDFYTDAGKEQFKCLFPRFLNEGQIEDVMYDLVSKDGTIRHISLTAVAIKDASGNVKMTRGVMLDITKRKEAENRVQHLNRLYTALSRCNEVLLRCTSEEDLYQRMCQLTVQFGGMKMAWIGLLDEASHRVNPAFSYGSGTEYLKGIQISVNVDDPHGRGPTGTAIRENQPIWFEDLENEPRIAPWRDLVTVFGLRAAAAIPICRGGKPIGAMTFYSSEFRLFDEEIRKLLVEMGADISFALDKLAANAEAENYQATLAESEQRFRTLVEQSIAGAFIVQDRKFVYINPRFQQILGYPVDDWLLGHNPLEIVAGKDRKVAEQYERKLLEGQKTSLSGVFTALRKDRTTTEVGITSSIATYQQRPAIIGLMQDISDKKVAEEQIKRYNAQLHRSFMQTVALATTLNEMRDPYTAGHERRVADLAVAIGTEMGLDENRLEGLKVGGYLHDVGKTTIPLEILTKPGKITPLEYRMIQVHPQAGYEVLKDVDFPWPVAQIALQHHERMDGSGYPSGLKGEEIMLEARIIAVADVIEAMASHRPFRAGLGIDSALAEIERGSGSAYDPVIAKACRKLFREKGYKLSE